MRILLWHGYLLGGTGSNVYTRALAREWSRAGHDVVVVCQERDPERFDLGGATVVTPELPAGRLPVFVLDRYAGLEPKLLQDFSTDELDAYVGANAAALRALLPADIVFANHVLLGAPVGVATGVPFRVKAHGSELEYSMRGRPELERWGAETLARADVTYVGSAHIRQVLEEVVGQVSKVREVPPGVDVGQFRLQDRDEALADLLAEARLDPPNLGNAEERLPDAANAERLAEFLAGDEPTVVYFGKLIEQKGVQVLLEAMAGIEARLVIVGFGPYRGVLEQLAPPRTLFTGPLEHRHLVHLLPLAAVTVVPSIFPEAFGMVAAEAAAAGSPPLVARHSGLAEVAAGLEQSYPERFKGLASFETGDARDLAGKLERILALSREDHDELRRAARQAVVDRWSWSSVAERLLQPV
jgi:glycosyltransferase involved in cell wall biosynthesis